MPGSDSRIHVRFDFPELVRFRPSQGERDAELKRRSHAIKALEETQKANEYLKEIKACDVVAHAWPPDR